MKTNNTLYIFFLFFITPAFASERPVSPHKKNGPAKHAVELNALLPDGNKSDAPAVPPLKRQSSSNALKQAVTSACDKLWNCLVACASQSQNRPDTPSRFDK